MEEALKQKCTNCEFEFDQNSNFCPNCGQKNISSMQSFGHMLSDLMSGLFNVDNRAFKTLVALFKPGVLTLKYFEGKRQSYSNPLKFYLFLSFLLFGLISIQFDNEFKESNIFQKLDTQKSLSEKERIFELDSISDLILQKSANKDYGNGARSMIFLDFSNNLVPAVADTFTTSISEIRLDEEAFPFIKLENTDSILLNYKAENETYTELIHQYDSQLARYLKPDSLSIGIKESGNGVNSEPIRFSMEDLIRKSPTEVAEKYNINKAWKKLYLVQAMKIAKEPGEVFYFAITGFSWIAILFVPLMALWLKLMYIRRNRYYIEHLVFTLHVVSFLFILTFFILAGMWVFEWNWSNYFWFIIPVYLYIATRTFYKQGKSKSFIKMLLNGIVSLLFMQFLLLISIFFRILLF